MDAGTEALLSLISHDKSGKSSSINDLSDNIYMWMRSAVSSNKGLVDLEGSCLEATPILRKATDEADHTNLLIESWSLYLSSELFVTEFQAFAYFNYYISCCHSFFAWKEAAKLSYSKSSWIFTITYSLKK